eukprot:TRINITY_DN27361_c0_g1_i1.p1 TRINITY_DN27361_c0_g1~~TRINITY_DN27361_c0_g1_i1.p1  ORF type:complete len:118 (-),score=37.78 TRINITY_DN27361_c0_g1_i1:285-638(-)
MDSSSGIVFQSTVRSLQEALSRMHIEMSEALGREPDLHEAALRGANIAHAYRRMRKEIDTLIPHDGPLAAKELSELSDEHEKVVKELRERELQLQKIVKDLESFVKDMGDEKLAKRV